MVLGATLATSPGLSLAGGSYMHKSEGEGKTMKHQPGGSGEYGELRGPVEAGTLPGMERGSGMPEIGDDPSTVPAEFDARYDAE